MDKNTKGAKLAYMLIPWFDTLGLKLY